MRRYPCQPLENSIRVKVVDAVVELVAGAHEELVAEVGELLAVKEAIAVGVEGGQAFVFAVGIMRRQWGKK